MIDSIIYIKSKVVDEMLKDSSPVIDKDGRKFYMSHPDKPVIYERNPDTGGTRWRYLGDYGNEQKAETYRDSADKMGLDK
tara:strand:+ start:413 stop:652 length:240 start_codon:yes stop_codon:yes gene_type:complete